MMQGAEGAHTYGATRGSNEDSKLMATAMAGTAFQAAKREASRLKAKVLSLRDGTLSMSILSYIGGASLVVVGSFTFLGNFFTLKIISAVVNLYLLVFGLVIVLIEARNSIFPPIVIEYIREYFAFITVVWGRGGFFIFVGTLALAQWDFIDIILGIYLIGLGAGMIYWGMGAANALDALVHEMKDPERVEEMFNKFDHDGNGQLETNELADLLKSLGAELRPPEVEVASLMMDRDHNGKISLQEFKNWWIKTDIVDAVVYD